MITLTPEPMRVPLPPQTRYDYPINKLQSYLLQAVFWLSYPWHTTCTGYASISSTGLLLFRSSV